VSNNTQLKYKMAIAWCEVNKQRLKKTCKFRLMTSENLYIMLEALGTEWSKHRGEWIGGDHTANGKRFEVTQRVHVDKVSGRTLIRIIAHRSLIDRRCSEFREFCELLNWRIVKESDNYENEAGDFLRCYFTIDIDENRD
jgi:hypothetical protein